MAEQKNNTNNSQTPEDNKGRGKNPKPKFNVYWIYGIIGVALLGTYFLRLGNGPEQITRRQFETEMLASYDVQKIVIVNKERVEVYI